MPIQSAPLPGSAAMLPAQTPTGIGMVLRARVFEVDAVDDATSSRPDRAEGDHALLRLSAEPERPAGRA